MLVIAHIGKVPVEEYLAFVVPVVVLYAYGRQWNRRRRKQVARLPGPGEPLDETTVQLVLSRWAEADHGEVPREQVALMYPPGPDGVTPAELAERIGADPTSVARRLEDLADLGYVEFDADERGPRLWLTVEGINLLNVTEDALLTALENAAGSPDQPASARH